MKRIIILLFSIIFNSAFAQERNSYYPHHINNSPTASDKKPTDHNVNDNHKSGIPDVIESSPEDNCASAQVLTINGGCYSGTTVNNTLEAWECTGDGTSNWRSSWYRFNTGANTTLNLAWIYTNSPPCYPCIWILGPYTAGTGCGSCAPLFYSVCYQNGDPGYHAQLTGLTANKDYLIDIQSLDANGCFPFGSASINYCIAMYTVPSNDPPPGTNLNNCGVSFNGNNNGYSPDGTGLRKANLDANNATTCGSCGTAGDDVPYVINNDQWFYFCTVNAGTYNITINNIANCVLAPTQGVSSGIQSSILLGPTTAFTNLYDFPNPMNQGSSNTSSNFALTAGQCIYIPIDGFAGDQCTYSFTLTNVTGGCLILPVELTKFDMKIDTKEVDLYWETATETNNDVYIVQRSIDGSNYENIGFVKSNGNTDVPTRYDFMDKKPNLGMNYYRLLQRDKNGKTNELGNGIAKFYSDLSNYANIAMNVESSNLNVELSSAFVMGIYSVSVYNMLGEKVYSTNILQQDNIPGNFSLDLSSLKSGIYSCTIEGGYNTFIKKSFVKN